MKSENKPRNDNELEITITTARGEFSGVYPKTAKVQQLIDDVKDHFDLSGDGTFDLYLEGENEPLKPERTLVSYGFEDGTSLVLTMGGKNV
jgi:hypothetical protein